MPDRSPEYLWDQRLNNGLGAYRNAATGRVVARAEVVTQLERVATASRATMRDLSQRLMDGTITLPDWQRAMMQEIKTVHGINAAAAKGGWAQMSQTDWGRVGYRVRQEYAYLQNFAAEIASGKQPLNGRLLVRAEMYGRAGHNTFEAFRKAEARDRGKREERRVLRAQESCPGCIEQAARGWVPLGSLPPIGSQECRTNCRCEDEYR